MALAGTYGSATLVPRVTVNASGRITAVTEVPIEQVTPSNETILAPGSTWTNFMTAYNAINPASDPIWTIYLPDESITQTSSLFITKPVRILGTGPNSKLLALGDLTLSGSPQQIAIGYGGYPTTPYTTVDGVELAYFTMEHTRNATNRMIAVSVFGHTKNLAVHHMTFVNITSDVFIFRNESSVAIEGQVGVMEDIHIHHNVADEWYESFFNHHEGSMSRCYVYDNVCTVSEPHPNVAVSVPYGAICNIEESAYDGLIEDLHIYNNSFISTMEGRGFNDSIGFVMRRNQEPDFRYNRVYLEGNTFSGWNRGLWHLQTQTVGGSTLFPGLANIYYTGNTFELCGNGSIPAVLVYDYGGDGDYVVLGDNDVAMHGDDVVGLSVVLESSDDVTIVQTPPNRVV